MSNQLPKTSEDRAAVHEILRAAERRKGPRVDCHTVVTAIYPAATPGDATLRVTKAYSEDISTGGARLIANEELATSLVYLRFLLPSFGERYVEAEIVSRAQRKRQWVTGKTTTQHIYGVRFTGAMIESSALEAKLTPADTPQPEGESRE